MDWTSLLPLAAIGLMFFFMMRNGSGCCGGGHSRHQENRKDPANKDEARPAKEQPDRK